jgi:hypothetical protein
VIRLVEQDAGLLPRTLLISPVGVFGRDYRIHVRTGLRVPQQSYRIPDCLYKVFQALVVQLSLLDEIGRKIRD